jgi:hypothetical protein
MLSGIGLDIHSEMKKSLKIKHIHIKNEIRLFKGRNSRRRWNSNKRIKRGWKRINIKTKRLDRLLNFFFRHFSLLWC